MDQQFGEQIGNNLKVYTDDLVIKILEEDQMIVDIEDTFKRTRKISMKLKPNKCSFGIVVVVTKDGFKANPEKEQAISHIPSLKSLKEVQTLNQRLVTMNMFLANHASK